MVGKRSRQRGRKHIRETTIHGSRVLPPEEAAAIRLSASRNIVRHNERARAVRYSGRRESVERPSVQKAMDWVERKVVDAIWTLQRLPADRYGRPKARHGIDYILERAERYANAIEHGGWDAQPPAPSPPDSRAIDEMHTPLDWFKLLPNDEAKILWAGASWKRGDAERRVSWIRVRDTLPDGFQRYSSAALRGKYKTALRTLAAEVY